MVGGERVGRFLTKESRGKMWEVMKAQASRWSTMRRLLLCRDTSDDINDTYVYFLFSSRLILRTTELLMNEDTIEISSSPFPFPKKDPSIDFRVINVYLYTLQFDSNITNTTIFIMIYQRLYISEWRIFTSNSQVGSQNLPTWSVVGESLHAHSRFPSADDPREGRDLSFKSKRSHLPFHESVSSMTHGSGHGWWYRSYMCMTIES